MQKLATHDNSQTNRDAVTVLEQYDNWFLNNYSFTIDTSISIPIAETEIPRITGFIESIFLIDQYSFRTLKNA